MATQNEIDSLAQLYLDARERLYRTITGDTGVGTKTYANTILRQLETELRRLKKASNRFVDKRVPKEYRRELDSLYAYFTRHNLLMKSPEAFASLHNDAIYAIAREMQYQLDDALITVGRQVTRYVERARDETLRQAGLRHAGIKAASGGTVENMRSALLKDLLEQGFMTVQYGGGKNARQVPVDVYAGMVSRSTIREAENTARLNQLTANGYDLIEITEHYPTCEVCAPLQGRVYSISGNDKRFPPLSRAFGRYNNIHPNCRHVAVPYIETLRTPEEISSAIEKSNRPFEDSRSAQEVARYNEQQGQNRRARETLYQYERYKAVLGSDAPKTYMEFARLKKAGGDKWELVQLDYQRRNDLRLHPEKVLPNAASASAADAKFIGYLFDPSNARGWAKGVAFESRLGYNANNWTALQAEILRKAPLYPTVSKGEDVYGTTFEQKIVIRGLRGKPANVTVGWKNKDGKTWMTTVMIKEVR